MPVEPVGAAQQTAAPSFKLAYDPALPITAHREEILAALARYPVIVVCGATGSGKTTQLPKLCLEAGRGTAGLIGHTQPRRIAARALASRLAEELGTTLPDSGDPERRGGAKARDRGGIVGYKVRFNDRTGPNVRVKLMTDGILLKELESDRRLRRYDTLIIDEAHERSLNIDLLLGVLKQLVPKRPDLRVIVTSATIDPGKFASFFGGAPVIEVSGRSYPVEVRYRPLVPEESEENDPADEDATELSLPEGIVAAVRELDAEGQGRKGDTLVFLPGEKHIREAAEALNRARLPNTEVLPLFARLSTKDQERIFQPHHQRRLVLATNVAETSLTVPGIRFVIDSGLARISRYSVRGKVQRLPIERVSKASADQRKGRCGREAEGICIRLYSEEDFGQREEYTPPEILRTNLASVILRMAALGLGEPENFPFLDPPDTRLVNDGVRLLQELKAMDAERRVTSLGQQIAVLPVDPRLGAMLLAASRHQSATEMLIIASFLEAQDPRERPSEAGQQASEKHASFADPRSDFVTVLNLWRAFNEQAANLSGNQLRKWCREHYLSFVRMREWQDLHAQLSQNLQELRLRPNQVAASYSDLHQAILTGFLGSIGSLDAKREYDGARGTRFVIAPGTPLASKPPKWVVAGSLLETTRLYARMVAAVDPGWIEAAGAHLLKRTYTEPHWVDTRGFVAAFESVSLYGLTLASRRRVNYGAIAPAEAREMFIREALIETQAAGEGEGESVLGDPVLDGHGGGRRREPPGVGAAGDGRSHGPGDLRHSEQRGSRAAGGRFHGQERHRAVVQSEFLAANRRLRQEIELLEAKIRRRDILVDEDKQLEFYATRIPERVNSVAAFNHWEPEAQRRDPRLLYMSRADLMRRDAPEAGPDRFPDELEIGANKLPLQYKFEPAEPDDGITLIVPEPLLDAVNAEQIAWLVPGMRLEKIIELFRALPKAQRKQLVPVPDHARRALEDLESSIGGAARLPPFHEWLAGWVTQQVGESVTPAQLSALELPPYLRMNLRVIDAGDRVLAEGRDLAALKRKLYGSVGGSAGRPWAVGLGAGTSGAVAAGDATHAAGGSAAQAGRGPTGNSGPSGRGRHGQTAPHGQGVAHGQAGATNLHRAWDFGDVPESREVDRNRLRLVVFPAIEDHGSGVMLVEARNALLAESLSRAGVVRLAMLALPQQAKYVNKRMADDRDLVLMSRGLPFAQPLADALTQRAFRECFMPPEVSLPRTRAAFNSLLETRRGELNDIADKLAATVSATLREWRVVRSALESLRSPDFKDAVADIHAQLAALLPPDFIETTPRQWLESLPRYLKAIARRLERLPGNARRDAELAGKVKPFAAALRTLAAQPSVTGAQEELDQLRWMIEEYRVSLYAQDLKTVLRVSDKRLAEQLERAKAEAQG